MQLLGVIWINIYKNRKTGLVWDISYYSREAADEAANMHADEDERIACCQARWVEGQKFEEVL